MTLTATSHSITAQVTGMDAAFSSDRTFKWFLDGQIKATERVPPGSASHSFTFDPVYFGSTHRVRCEIYNADATVLLATLTGSATTLYADEPLWDWTASNGSASALQTAAAYTALSNQGQTAAMNFRVWNDLQDKVYRIVTNSGIPWKGEHPGAVMSRSELTAAAMNLLVDNIEYPIWTWRDKPNASGYLGRIAFRGVHQYGKDADYVLGAYILELAKNLNIIIRIYTDGDDLARMTAAVPINISSVPHLIARHSAPLQTVTGMVLSSDTALDAKAAAHLAADGQISIGTNAALAAAALAELAASVSAEISTAGNLTVTQEAFLAAAAEIAAGGAGTLGRLPTAQLTAAQQLTISGAAALGTIVRASLAGRAEAALTAAATAGRVLSRRLSGETEITLTAAGTMRAVRFAPTEGAAALTLAAAGTAQAHQILPITGSAAAQITAAGSCDASQITPITAAGTAAITQRGTVSLLHAASLAGHADIGISTAARMGSWQDPERITADTLRVYQSWQVTQTDDTLEVT